MIYNKKVTAVILAAGNSIRYGQNRNKNFEIINGKHVLLYSLEKFDKNRYIDNIKVAAKSDEFNIINKMIKTMDINKEIDLVIGGDSRKKSVYNCIKDDSSDIVIIHDGARPAIKQEYINKCLKEMNTYNGVTMGVNSKDTIKIVDKNLNVISTTRRDDTWIIQTPQCFDRKILLDMYKKYYDYNITDECELLEKGGYKIKVIEGDYTNLKITTYEDLKIIKNFL